jgi:hypothetical protein
MVATLIQRRQSFNSSKVQQFNVGTEPTTLNLERLNL